MKHYIAMWKNILNFSGRTSRAGYWVPMILNILVVALVSWLLPDFANLFGILLSVATFTLTCRRMRDAGVPALAALLNFAGSVPAVGWILALVPEALALLPSKK